MRICIMLSLFMISAIAGAQQAQPVNASIETINLAEALAKKHTVENMDELIDLGGLLPIAASAEIKGSEEWILDRQKSIGLYLKWYQKMFAAGFDLDQRAIIGAESEGNIQENNAIKSFLVTEQRLKRFLKNNFKGNKKKQFKIAAQSYGENYDSTAETIVDEILHSKFGFVVYEKSLQVD